MRRLKVQKALYGNVKIERAYCGVCETWAFVKDNVIQCCDSEVNKKLGRNYESRSA